MSADGAGGGAAQGLVRRTRPAIPAPGRRLPAGAALVLSLWAVATSVNLLKPFHIDDAAHLLIAEWIASNPLRPMSGMLNWGDIAEPIFNTNQPHFYFYAMALIGSLFGFSEVPMHVLMGAFALLAIAAFHALAARFAPSGASFLTVCFVISPGFLVNQNSMVDVPLVAIMMSSVLLATSPVPGDRSCTGAFATYSLAVLTKYSSLFLYPALVSAALLRCGLRSLRTAWLPAAAILLWSLFNILDFGAAHITHRPSASMGLTDRAMAALVFFGTFGIFTLPVALGLLGSARCSSKAFLLAAGSAAALLYGAAVLARGKWTVLSPLNAVLTGSVAVVALLAGLRCARLVVGLAAPRRLAFLARVEACSGAVTLASWLVAGAMFLVLFAPFNASRHALLLVPPLFLLAYQEAVRDSVAPRSVTARPWLVLYAAAALYVAACDREMARFYRAAAPVASERALRIAGEGAVIYFRGHWGWQWYAGRTGMREFDLARSDLAVGDVLVDPVGVHAQRLPPGVAFETADIVREDTGPLSVLDTLPLYIVLRGAEPNLAPRPPRVIRILRRVM